MRRIEIIKVGYDCKHVFKMPSTITQDIKVGYNHYGPSEMIVLLLPPYKNIIYAPSEAYDNQHFICIIRLAIIMQYQISKSAYSYWGLNVHKEYSQTNPTSVSVWHYHLTFNLQYYQTSSYHMHWQAFKCPDMHIHIGHWILILNIRTYCPQMADTTSLV